MARNNKQVAGKDVKSSVKIADERAVRETDETVPVKPVNKSDVPDRPTDPAAVDQRKQFTGTDEHATDRRG